MPEAIKSLAVILAIALPLLLLARVPVCATAMTLPDYRRRRNLWLMLTVAAFLSGSLWIYLAIASLLLAIAWHYESRPLGLYLFLLLAVPPISAEIGAFGLVNQLFAIDHTRLLSLLVLLPAAIVLARRDDTAPFGYVAADWCVAGYLLLLFAIQLAVDTVTDSLRLALYGVLDTFLPYYVASRLVRDTRAFRDALISFVIAAVLVAATALCDFVSHWLAYSVLPEAWGVPWEFGHHLVRGELLRAQGSAGHPIVLGYLMAVALGLALFLRKAMPAPAWHVAMALLLGGLLASLSRGPWVGFAVLLLLHIATGRQPLQRIALPALLILLAAPILLVFPLGGKYLDYLPFIGNIDAYNVEYRHRLLDISLDVIADNLWFGNYHFLDDMRMQTLMQGEKIIDLVNSYLSIALHSGLAGLALVLGFFISILAGIVGGMRRLADRDGEEYRLGRAMFATLVGIMVIIFTTSSIATIPLVYWTVAGLGAAYSMMLARQRRSAASPEARVGGAAADANFR